MVMEQIANLSTRKCCPGSNPGLSAFIIFKAARQLALSLKMSSGHFLYTQSGVYHARRGRSRPVEDDAEGVIIASRHGGKVVTLEA